MAQLSSQLNIQLFQCRLHPTSKIEYFCLNNKCKQVILCEKCYESKHISHAQKVLKTKGFFQFTREKCYENNKFVAQLMNFVKEIMKKTQENMKSLNLIAFGMQDQVNQFYTIQQIRARDLFYQIMKMFQLCHKLGEVKVERDEDEFKRLLSLAFQNFSEEELLVMDNYPKIFYNKINQIRQTVEESKSKFELKIIQLKQDLSQIFLVQNVSPLDNDSTCARSASICQESDSTRTNSTNSYEKIVAEKENKLLNYQLPKSPKKSIKKGDKHLILENSTENQNLNVSKSSKKIKKFKTGSASSSLKNEKLSQNQQKQLQKQSDVKIGQQKKQETQNQNLELENKESKQILKTKKTYKKRNIKVQKFIQDNKKSDKVLIPRKDNQKKIVQKTKCSQNEDSFQDAEQQVQQQQKAQQQSPFESKIIQSGHQQQQQSQQKKNFECGLLEWFYNSNSDAEDNLDLTNKSKENQKQQSKIDKPNNSFITDQQSDNKLTNQKKNLEHILSCGTSNNEIDIKQEDSDQLVICVELKDGKQSSSSNCSQKKL